MIFLILESWVTFFGVNDAHDASTFQGMLTTVFVRFFILYFPFLIMMAGLPPCLPLGLAWGLFMNSKSS